MIQRHIPCIDILDASIDSTEYDWIKTKYLHGLFLYLNGIRLPRTIVSRQGQSISMHARNTRGVRA